MPAATAEPPTVAGARASQQALDAWLAELEPVAPDTATRLPDWTVGHLLTHLARNADSHVRMLDGLPQYAGGMAERNDRITAGAGRPWPELLADLHTAQSGLAAAWSAVADWSRVVEHGDNTRTLADLAFYRWREAEVHRADLGLGYTFADMPGEYVRRELVNLTMRYRASKPIGLTDLPAAAAQAPPPLRLAWLMGRADIAGLPAAGIF